jgi:hypothetical protein
LNEGDDAHLCFAFGALQRVDFIDSLDARGPTTFAKLTAIVALLFLVWRSKLSALTSTPTGLSSVVPGDGFVGLWYVNGECCQKLQSIELMSRAVFGGVGDDVILN